MTEPLFADTFYWIALINPKDQWRQRAVEVSRNIGNRAIVTTDEVLIETLNYFSESGKYFRELVAHEVEQILLNQKVEVIDQNHAGFLNGFELYQNRLDKNYSLTDCISMNVCRERGISEVLTHDHHFKQEGFQILL